MKFISDEILYLYLLKPESLDKETSDELEKMLKSDIDTQIRIKEIKKFYEELNKINYKPITLTSFSIYNQADNHRLAAMNNANMTDDFQYLTTYASAEKLIIIRVHYNKSKKEYKLYLVTDDMDNVKNVKLRIRGYNKDLVTDNDGVVTVKDVILDENTITDIIEGEYLGFNGGKCLQDYSQQK